MRLSVCLSVCSLLRYRLTVFLPPIPEVGCPIFLEIRNPFGKVMERSGLTFEHFCLEVVLNCRAKKFFFADFALQNMVETTLTDGLLGFWVFLVHPPMASVLLSPSVERCFVSRMRDFSSIFLKWVSFLRIFFLFF